MPASPENQQVARTDTRPLLDTESPPKTRLSPEELEAQMGFALGMTLPVAVGVAWQMAIRLTKHPADADDLCQVVFVRLADTVTKGACVIEAGRERSYLRTAVANAHRDSLRRLRTVRTALGSRVELDESAHAMAVSLENPERDAVAGALSDEISEALKSLKQDQRQVMLLLIQGGYSVRGIAEMLGLPTSTVRNRIQSAKRDIRARLRKTGWEVER